ncbi:hypothetical protein F5Y16DRAFT_400938 [Xylariaceae sp. FL0255]|nr:hypothetical protein F5Y16DRAFT_400938 [Xylariaceae sp. FL0255]
MSEIIRAMKLLTATLTMQPAKSFPMSRSNGLVELYSDSNGSLARFLTQKLTADCWEELASPDRATAWVEEALMKRHILDS